MVALRPSWDVATTMNGCMWIHEGVECGEPAGPRYPLCFDHYVRLEAMERDRGRTLPR